MTKGKMVTGLAKAVKMEQVPTERFGVIVQRTILGTLLIAFGLVGLAKYQMNHYLAVGLVLLGATVWSTQLVTNSLKALIQPVKAIKRAVSDE
jgi:hypothetical protein